MSEIVFLASYPKSGNTWFRAFLTALLDGSGTTPDVNRLVGPLVVGWATVEDLLGFAGSELDADEVLDLRPQILRNYARCAKDEVVYVKTHDALAWTSTGEPSIPTDLTRAVVYLVRSPLDVCVSYAHHAATTMEQMIAHLDDPHARVSRHSERSQVAQPIGTWSGHVESWTSEPPVPVHVVRYDDMVSEAVPTFAAAAQAIGLQRNRDEIERALRATTFERLMLHEREHGFQEKMTTEVTFFRSGRTGTWQTELQYDQVNRLVESHGRVMRQLGYLSEKGPTV